MWLHELFHSIGITPRIAVVAGSGAAHALAPYPTLAHATMEEVLGLPAPSVIGHGAMVSVIDVEGTAVLLLGGRHHLYEGYDVEEVCRATTMCHAAGVERILYTNAAGGLDPALNVGDVVICDDVMLGTWFPLPLGSAIRSHRVIDEEWKGAIASHALHNGWMSRSGVYVMVKGPSYETRAEIRMYREYGANVIGMSTVAEAKHAAQLGMKVAVLSLVTNRLTDISTAPLSHDHVVQAGKDHADQLQGIIKSAILCI